MKNNSRREFIRLSTMASLGFMGLHHFACNPVKDANPFAFGYGPLIPDPQNFLDLPEGFSYKIISQMGNTMSDGLMVPGLPDGMATFSGKKGKVVIVRNHEISPDDLERSPYGKDNGLLSKVPREKFYDYGQGELPGLGGTTTLVFNEKTQEVEEEYLSLAGTIRNCAGGRTPWDSWITCEETLSKAGEYSNEQDHGFNFEVPALGPKGLVDPIALKEMGRFNHEAVCVDPRTGIVYQTEDAHDSLFYRYIPHVKGELAKGGKLQILAIKEQKSMDTRNWPVVSEANPEIKLPPENPMEPGKWFETEWLDIDGIDSPDNDLRLRGFAKGAARFARGEGTWFGDNELFFACTSGGQNQQGQVFRYVPGKFEGTNREHETPGKIQLFAEPNDTDICKSCDNLTISPWGDVVMCEDHSDAYIVGLTPEGEFYKLGNNKGFPTSEFAGVCFSPSGKTMFVNMQVPGITIAVTGPWRKAGRT